MATDVESLVRAWGVFDNVNRLWVGDGIKGVSVIATELTINLDFYLYPREIQLDFDALAAPWMLKADVFNGAGVPVVPNIYAFNFDTYNDTGSSINLSAYETINESGVVAERSSFVLRYATPSDL